VRDRLAATLVPLAPEELAQLLLQRLLQNQPRTQPADRLDRIVFLADAGDDLSELAAQPLTPDYCSPSGRTSSSTTSSTRRLRPTQFPRLTGRDLAPHGVEPVALRWLERYIAERKPGLTEVALAAGSMGGTPVRTTRTRG